MSDNGQTWGDHRWTSKNVPYERSVHVPFIVKMPGQTTSQIADELVMNADITPTVFDLLGITPDDPVFGSQLDGQSLLPLLVQSGTFEPRSGILLEHLNANADPSVPSYCGLRTRNWKYVAYSDGFEELYNMNKDPDEMKNKASTKPAQVARLRERTEALCDPPPPDFPQGFWANL